MEAAVNPGTMMPLAEAQDLSRNALADRPAMTFNQFREAVGKPEMTVINGGRFNFEQPAVKEFVVKTYDKMTAREQAKQLGCSYSSLIQYRQRLLAQGILDQTKRAYQPGWPQEVLDLMERLAGRYTAEDMHRAIVGLGFEVTWNAVKVKATRGGWLRYSQGKIGMEDGLLTPEEIMADFEGRPFDENVALTYVRKNVKQYNKPWYRVEYNYLQEEVGRVSPNGIGAFLGRSERAVKHKMTQFGLSMLDNQGHLTLPIIADEMGVSTAVVERWVKKGWLTAFVPAGARRYLVVEQVEFEAFKKKLTAGEFLEDGWCAVCRAHFKKRHNQSKKIYCSDECKHKAELDKQRARTFSFEKAQVMVDCEVCGKEFVYGRRRLTCSDECADYRLKQYYKIKKRLRELIEVYGREHPMVQELWGSQEEFCRGCGKKIPPYSYRRAYCSKSCAERKLKVPTLDPRPCGHEPCGRMFAPYNNFQRYCSSLCKIEAIIARGEKPPSLEATEQFCKECGAIYYANRVHKYCSKECRAKSDMRRKTGGRREGPWVPQELECPECKAMFTQNRWNQSVCSKECRRQVQLRNAKASPRYNSSSKYTKAPKRPRIECEVCYKPFRPKHDRHTTCSSLCRDVKYYTG